jgi:ATPase subunit of ABC transporter with duplicated ATPase domains
VAVLVGSSLRVEIAGTPLFDGVSFTLRRRDRLALAGPNGAGKTTLLRTIIGELRRAAGLVERTIVLSDEREVSRQDDA